MEFFRVTTRRPVAISMVVTAVLVFGLVSYNRLPLTLMPRMNFPSITVRTTYPGAAPEEVEQSVTRRIEEAVSVASGLNSMVSSSRAEMSNIVLSFSWDTDINLALQDVREKLDQVFLPEEVDRPLILRYDPNLDPVVSMALAANEDTMDLKRLRTYAEEELRFLLDRIPGVAAVKIRGGLEEEIVIELDNNQMAVLGIDAAMVANRLAQENINLSGGILKQGTTEYLARTLSEYAGLQEIGDTVITVREDRALFLRDIAKVGYGHRDRDMVVHITRAGGEPREAVLLDFYKEADANIVSVAEAVLRTTGVNRRNPPAGTIAAQLPEGVSMTLLSNQARFIAGAVNEVRDTAMVGGILAVLVLLLFLGKTRPTLIIGTAIPFSIVATFAPLNLQGISLNIMSLGGLALGVGMLVDNAIVVLESITRCQEEGDGLIEACVRGTGEVGTAVIASTLTTIAVFFPLVFVQGIAGELFGDLAMAVVYALIVSLLVALFVIPMLASRGANPIPTGSMRTRMKSLLPKVRFLEPFRRPMKNKLLLLPMLPIRLLETLILFVLYLAWWVFFIIFLAVGGVISLVILAARWVLLAFNRTAGRAMGWFLDRLKGAYRVLLGWSLGHGRVFIWLGIGLAFWFTWRDFNRLDTELIPAMHQGQFQLHLELPVGTTVEAGALLARDLQTRIAAIPRVRGVFSAFGVDREDVTAEDDGPQTARINVVLRTENLKQELAQFEAEIMDRVRLLAADIPDAEAELSTPALFSFSTPVEVQLQDYDLARLAEITPEAMARLSKIGALEDITTTWRRGKPEILLRFDREKLAFYNLNVDEISQRLRRMIQGDVPTRFSRGDRRVDIRVRLQEDQRRHLEDLGQMTINPGAEAALPLNAIAQFEVVEGPGEIRRVDQKRSSLIRAGVAGAGLTSITRDIEAALSDLDIDYTLAGQSLEFEKSKSSLILAVLLSIFLVYVVMASQFESVIHPLIILFSIPLAFFGVVEVLVLMNLKLSILVFLGVILLAGIVVNNAIVLVDYINLERRRGLALKEALLEAGTIRLRPILMTTMTTVLGLLPMALGLGEGAELRRPMAVTVIAGLSFSTLLTLVVIPVIYYTVEKWREGFRATA
ncbi:MAG: efflux RND transporter permease subunit [Acidobacteriota bacterium]|nr:efflux RND transporter permease subunit [Acidobacteriota bacterium]